MNHYDIVVIGAGIAGASIAYFLAPHARVLMLEREPFAGMHTTGRSAAHFSEIYGSPQVRALSRATHPFLDAPPPGFANHPILRRRGSLVVASEGQVEALLADYEALRVHTPSLAVVDHASIKADVPVMRPEASQKAIWEPNAADIDVNELHQSFLRGAKDRGATLRLDTEVTSLERDGTGWLINEAIRTPIVVNAAGAWADVIAGLAGVAPIGLEPRRRSAFLFEPPEGLVTTDWPFILAFDESYYFKPDAGLLLGSPANADPTYPHDVQPEEYDIALGIHRIEEATTMIIRRPKRIWAGLRSFVPGGDLVGGFANDAPGFFWLAAQGGYGIQTSAAMGESCAMLALGRELPAHLQDAGVTPAMLAPKRG